MMSECGLDWQVGASKWPWGMVKSTAVVMIGELLPAALVPAGLVPAACSGNSIRTSSPSDATAHTCGAAVSQLIDCGQLKRVFGNVQTQTSWVDAFAATACPPCGSPSRLGYKAQAACSLINFTLWHLCRVI
jgi:hypothetical protein